MGMELAGVVTVEMGGTVGVGVGWVVGGIAEVKVGGAVGRVVEGEVSCKL